MDRSTLVRTLGELTPADFAMVVAALSGAASQTSHYVTIPEQAKELIRWAESPTGPSLHALERELLKALGKEIPPDSSAHFSVPFPRNPDFVGRTADLEALHAVLQKREPVGIRPAGLTGMGGIGKTQLAVEYVYRYKVDYPGGIFWLYAAESLDKGLAKVATELRPETVGQPLDQQLKAAFQELKQRPDALLVFDNLEDPAQLNRPVGTEDSPRTLACRILFTTRHRELGRFTSVEVSVLPEGPALQLLLRHDSRHPVRDDPKHPEHAEAKSIARLLGWLPLALELASAFLAEWPEVSLADYRKRLQNKGCLRTLDSEVVNLSQVNFQPIHDVAIAATLQTQWETLKQAEETARLLLRVAGQFSEAAVIPTAMLGLFAGVPDVDEPGDPSPLKRALKRLHDVRLVEELLERRVRLHPLVREFARDLTPSSETEPFRHDSARRVAQAFEDFTALEDLVRTEGVDGLLTSLSTALIFASEADGGIRASLLAMHRLFQREGHQLRGWNQKRHPTAFAQQVLFRAQTTDATSLVARAEHRLKALAQPYIALRWRTHRESAALVRLLTGHQG